MVEHNVLFDLNQSAPFLIEPNSLYEIKTQLWFKKIWIVKKNACKLFLF